MRSLAAEIAAVKDRVQNMIGDAHWPTVGAWKESVLRAVLRRHLPRSVHIGTGFILSGTEQSSQIDILIYDDNGPVLFRDGDLVIVTPDVARAVIEVKTSLTTAELADAVTRMDTVARLLRSGTRAPSPFFGIYCYEGQRNPETLLTKLENHNRGASSYPINCIGIGENQFVRFWKSPPNGPPRRYSQWHCYNLSGLAPAFFVHNVIDHLFPKSGLTNGEFWFPSTGKEPYLIGRRARN